jgi:hypothetical protein
MGEESGSCDSEPAEGLLEQLRVMGIEGGDMIGRDTDLPGEEAGFIVWADKEELPMVNGLAKDDEFLEFELGPIGGSVFLAVGQNSDKDTRFCE